MPVNLNWFENIMNEFAPLELAESWDNVGLLVGCANKEVDKILLALDLTDEVLFEAVDKKVNLILTHHPVIFKPLKSITDKSAFGKRIIDVIKNDIAVYCAHTNLDITNGGTNDVLFDILALRHKQPLFKYSHIENNLGMGRIGELKEGLKFEDFVYFIKDKLNIKSINFVKANDATVKRIALCTGAASDTKFILQAYNEKCDTYITGDVTYHNGQYALDMGINIIDGTHFATEYIFMDNVKRYIEQRCREERFSVEVIKSDIINKVFDTL